MSDRELLVSGDFATFSFADVLATVGLTRQLVDLVLLDAEGVRAGMLLKSGQILDVRNLRTAATGGMAFAQVIQDPGPRFQVARRQHMPPAIQPLGMLSEWLGEVEAGRIPGHAGGTPIRSAPPAPPRSELRSPSARRGSSTAPTQQLDPAPAASGRNVVVEGALAQFPLDDLFSVIGMSRQRMVLELKRGELPRGSLTLKAGHVLDVRTAEGLHGEAALHALVEDPGDRFTVVQQPPGRSDGLPLGRLVDLLGGSGAPTLAIPPPPAPAPPPALVPPPAPAPPAPTPPPAPTASEALLLEGRLTDFNLDDVLNVAALSRHCLQIRIHHPNHPDAVLMVKAGRVLGAQHGADTDPVQVLFSMLSEAGDTFDVIRRPMPPGAASKGTIRELLAEARAMLEDGTQSPTIRASVPYVSRPPPPPELRYDTATPAPAPPAPSSPAVRPVATSAPRMAPGSRLETLAADLDLLRKQISERRIETELTEILGLLRLLEERIEERDRSLKTLSGGSDRWLTAAVVGVQIITVIAVIFVGSAWLWHS